MGKAWASRGSVAFLYRSNIIKLYKVLERSNISSQSLSFVKLLFQLEPHSPDAASPCVSTNLLERSKMA
jgi:hypothetical protein